MSPATAPGPWPWMGSSGTAGGTLGESKDEFALKTSTCSPAISERRNQPRGVSRMAAASSGRPYCVENGIQEVESRGAVPASPANIGGTMVQNRNAPSRRFESTDKCWTTTWGFLTGNIQLDLDHYHEVAQWYVGRVLESHHLHCVRKDFLKCSTEPDRLASDRTLDRLKATHSFGPHSSFTVSCSAHDGFATTTRERTRSESTFGTTWSPSRNLRL
jgi:hypothetical protein